MQRDVGSGDQGEFAGVFVRARSGRAVVVLYRVIDGRGGVDQLVAYTFGATSTGLIDIIGMSIDSAPGCTSEEAYARAQDVGRGVTATTPARGLRSREVRAAVAQHGLIERASAYIEALATDRDPDVRQGLAGLLGADQVRLAHARDTKLSDPFLAAFVLEYAEALAAGRTRAEVGAGQEPPVSAKAVESWIRKATDRGLWARAGQSGKVGAPTALAHSIAGKDGA